MVNICIYEDADLHSLLPLTFNRPAYDLLLGIDTLFDKVYRYFNFGNISLHCRPQLKPLVKALHPDHTINQINIGAPCLFINGRVVMDQDLFTLLSNLDEHHSHLFTQTGTVICAFLRGELLETMKKALNDTPTSTALINAFRGQAITKELEHPKVIRNLWDITRFHAATLTTDFFFKNQFGIIKGKTHSFSTLYNENNIFIDKNSVIEDFVLLNANSGPIYIEEGVKVEAHSRLEGPLYIGKNATILGARIKQSSIGPHCKIGGEVSNSTILGYTNKAHSGFLGHSILGEWVNLGADTTVSNLKNNYTPITIQTEKGALQTSETFLGALIGDHVKTGIGTTFNTGTSVGFGSTLFNTGFHNKYIPAFSWGAPGQYEQHKFDKFLSTAKAMYARRKLDISRDMETVFEYLYSESKQPA